MFNDPVVKRDVETDQAEAITMVPFGMKYPLYSSS
jgi:hypothetical protein